MELDFSLLQTEASYRVWLRSRKHRFNSYYRRGVFWRKRRNLDELSLVLAQHLTPEELLHAFRPICVLRAERFETAVR
jgi:hypothetical protein